jgi:hypothetical protein
MKRKGDHLMDGYDIPEDGLPLDEQARILRGWPGYRTRDDRWGLDPVASPAEEARMEVLFLKGLFTGQFIAHHVFYLAIMFILGMMLGVMPLLLIVMELLFGGNWKALVPTSLGLPYLLGGWLLPGNVHLSIFSDRRSITGD